MRKIFALLALVAIMGTASAVFAISGNVTATANVLTPISVTNDLRQLDFGDILPGINKSVPFNDANSGKWRVDGAASREVAITFTLPAGLVLGLDSVPISFNATDAGHNQSDVVGVATPFDPSAGLTQNLHGATGELFIWLGGTVAPSPTQPAGVYTGTAIMDVVYTGL